MRKSFIAAAAFCAAMTCAPSMAQFTGPSAKGAPPAAREVTAATIDSAREGSHVTLTGNIVTHLGRDYFTFRDASGDLRVEIDDDIWRDRKIGPETRVRISGEVERDRRGFYVDVERLEVVN